MPISPAIFTQFFSLFTGKYKMWAWGLVALLVFGGVFWWISSDNARLKKENAQIELKMENNNLRATVEVQEAERKDLISKMSEMADSITRLNNTYAQNAIQKQRSYESMTGKVEKDAQGKIITSTLETKANFGMNSLFDGLEVLSQNEAKTK